MFYPFLFIFFIFSYIWALCRFLSYTFMLRIHRGPYLNFFFQSSCDSKIVSTELQLLNMVCQFLCELAPLCRSELCPDLPWQTFCAPAILNLCTSLESCCSVLLCLWTFCSLERLFLLDPFCEKLTLLIWKKSGFWFFVLGTILDAGDSNEESLHQNPCVIECYIPVDPKTALGTFVLTMPSFFYF